MKWLWIILGILAVLLLCLTRVGVHAVLNRDAVTLDVRFGLLRFRIFPGKEKTKSDKQEKKSNKKTKKEPAEAEKKPKLKFTLADIKDAVHTLAPPLKRALRRTRRGIRIQPLQLWVTLGGREDPAAAAELYGYLNAGMWTAMPVLEKLLVIPEPYLHLGIDFDTDKTAVQGQAGISIRIGTLLAVAFGVGIPALRWFLRFQKKNQQQPEKTAPVEQAA